MEKIRVEGVGSGRRALPFQIMWSQEASLKGKIFDTRHEGDQGVTIWGEVSLK